MISCESSDVKINNVPLYQLILEIQDYEEIYGVTKDIRALNYEILMYQVGDMIEVLVDPEKKKKILIETNGTYVNIEAKLEQYKLLVIQLNKECSQYKIQ